MVDVCSDFVTHPRKASFAFPFVATLLFIILPARLHEDTEMDRRVHASLELMKTKGRQDLSVGDLAQMVKLSPWHFTHLFKAETSKPPMQYLKELRMKKAEQMLVNTSLSVKEIVSALGLIDRSHFSREFKILHGLTPKKFIAQHRNY